MALSLSPFMQPKEYASFSSLIWTHASDCANTCYWKHYIIWGEGCDAAGLGGRWYTNLYPRRPGWYRTQFDAQAAIESHHLESERPALSMDDVELVWDFCHETTDRSFDELLLRTGLDESRLSDALARAYEIPLVTITIARGRVGYLRAPRAK